MCASSAGDAQALLHRRAGGRVLQELLLGRIQMVLHGERHQRRFVEGRQDQLLLARIGVDVTDREHARDVRLEFLGVDLDGALVELQSPLGDRTELRRQSEEHQQLLGIERVQRAVVRLDLDARAAARRLRASACATPFDETAACRRPRARACAPPRPARRETPARRCTSVSDAAFGASSIAQSSAESPPPNITSRRPWSCGGVADLVVNLPSFEAVGAFERRAAAAGRSRRRRR